MKFILCSLVLIVRFCSVLAQSHTAEKTDNFFFSTAQNDQTHSPFDAIGNSAVVTQKKGMYWGAMVVNAFLMKELTQVVLAGDYLSDQLKAGLWMSHYGMETFSSNEFNLWASKKLSADATFGVAFHGRNYRCGVAKSKHQIAASLGGQLRFTSVCKVGFSIDDLVSTFMQEKINNNPGRIKMGVCYSLSKETDLIIDAYKVRSAPPAFCLAISYRLSDVFKLSGAYESASHQLHLSIGLKHKKTAIIFQVQYHPMLGFSPGTILSNQTF